MMRWNILLLAGVIAVATAGCESPTMVMTTEGLSNQIPNGAANGQYAVLRAAFTKAQGRALAVVNGSSPAAATDQAIYQEFAFDGMGTVDDNCSDFFTTAGEHEKWISFTRDMIGATGTVASGALALTGAPKSAIAALILATGTAYNGLDVYTRNFLFGADNIDSVRTLILNALDAHRKIVLDDKSPWDFNNSMRVVLDHQEICRPSAIVALVKIAIKNGKVAPMQPAGSSDSALAAQDKNVELLIASDVGAPNGTVLPFDEIAALYWLYIAKPEANWLSKIKGTLATLPKGPYKKDGTANTTTWNAAAEARLTEDLKKLSSTTVAAINKQISDWKTQPPPVAAVAPKAHGAPAPLPPASTLPAAPSATPGSKHYSITVP